MFKLNGKKINLNVDLTVGEGEAAITYPSGSLKASPELRAELGITEEPDPIRPDDRLFYVSENEDGTYTAIPRPVEQTTGPVWDAIKAKRDQVKTGGVKVGTKWYHTDAESRIQHLGLLRLADATVAAGGTDTTTLKNPADGKVIKWKTMSGDLVSVTCKMANDLFAADAILDFSAHAAAETHKAAMEASTNPFEYDFSANWPQVYTDTLV